MKISIVITVYNGEKFISKAIRSCIEQSISKHDYEIIVVNDGSTDNTKYILDSFGDWIRVMTLAKNKGLPYACNIGIKQAVGQYVIRVDADDYVHEDILKVGSLFLNMNLEMDAAAFDYYLVNEHDEKIERVSAKDNPIACGIMFRKDHLIDIGLYDEKFRLIEDEDLRIRFLKKHSMAYISLPLYRYRMHGNNSTKNRGRVRLYRKKLKEKHNL